MRVEGCGAFGAAAISLSASEAQAARVFICAYTAYATGMEAVAAGTSPSCEGSYLGCLKQVPFAREFSGTAIIVNDTGLGTLTLGYPCGGTA